MQSSYRDNNVTLATGAAGYPVVDDRLSDSETWLLIAAFSTLLATLLVTFA